MKARKLKACKLKAYKPEKLVAVSRFREFFPTLPFGIQRDVYRRIEVLLEEENRWCDKGNYKHIAQILTSIALTERAKKRRSTSYPSRCGKCLRRRPSRNWRGTDVSCSL